MFRLWRSGDLRHRMTGWIGLVGAGVATVIVVAMSASGIREEFVRQGEARARQLALLAHRAVEADSPERLGLLLEAVSSASDVLEVAWISAADQRMQSNAGKALHPATRLALETALHRGQGASFRPGSQEAGDAAMLFLVPAAGDDAARSGFVALRISTSDLAGARSALIAYNLVAALIGSAVMTAAAWWLLGWLLKPVAEVEGAIEALADGAGVVELDPDKLGALAPVGRAVQRLACAHAAIDRRIGAMAQGLEGVVERVLETAATIRGEMEAQVEEVDAAIERLALAVESIAETERKVEQVSTSAGEAAIVLGRLDGSMNQVAEHMNALGDRVESSASASYEMAASIRQVSENAGRVRNAAQQTAHSAATIDRAVRAVGEAVVEASDLSREVSENAESGEVSVRGIVSGSEEMRSRTAEARDGHQRLGERIAEIGGIAEAIEAINRETNMLALNASIVAARAGESGRSFAVVAERVKTLASQTSASTAQIERHLGALQEESGNAERALDSVLESVERNLARARSTGASFDGIRRSAERATGRIVEIADLTRQQRESSERVAAAARATSEMVDSIGVALEQQQETSQQTSQTAEAALEVCREVQATAKEQRNLGHQVNQSIGSVDERMQAILAGISTHARVSQDVSDGVRKAFAGMERSSVHVAGLAEVAEALRADWNALRLELGKLRSGGNRDRAGSEPS